MSYRATQNLHEIEKEFFRKFRKRVTSSKKVDDLRRSFTSSVEDLMSTLLQEKVSLNGENIVFSPDEKKHYRINSAFHDTPAVFEALNDPEIRQILQKAAQTAHHRYLHLKKHPEKTELKIRN